MVMMSASASLLGVRAISNLILAGTGGMRHKRHQEGVASAKAYDMLQGPALRTTHAGEGRSQSWWASSAKGSTLRGRIWARRADALPMPTTTWDT